MDGEQIALLGTALTIALVIARSGEKLITWLVKSKGRRRDDSPTLRLSPEIEHKLAELYSIITLRDDDQVPRVYGPNISRKLDIYHRDVLQAIEDREDRDSRRKTWS